MWSWLVERHATARQHRQAVADQRPSCNKEIKRQFPCLHSQSAQQIVADFCEAIASAEVVAQAQCNHTHIPIRTPRYRQVIFTNQGAKIRGNRTLMLPCGTAGRLTIRIPKGVVLPGRLMEVRLDYGCVEIVCALTEDSLGWWLRSSALTWV